MLKVPVYFWFSEDVHLPQSSGEHRVLAFSTMKSGDQCELLLMVPRYWIPTTSVKNVGKVSYFSPPLPPYAKLKYT